MLDSDSSSLSSVPPSEDELEQETSKPVGLARYFKPTTKPNYDAKVVAPPASPPPPKREPSPPHEFKLIDNDAIAVIVMFRSRFHNAFSRSCPHFGPQELEAGVRDDVPTEQAERLLCALLALCLNRKKDPEREHYGRALEEAVQTHSSQWPRQWEGKNPLHGGGSFKTMSPEQRLVLLRALVFWSLSSSQAVQAIMKESYKQARHEDDRNQPLSVQPWGRDGYKRRYWLIEGQDDTHFELYRENNGATAKTNVWFGVAGTIDELKVVADRLEEEGTPHARALRDRITQSIPRFEAGEEKRRRRDYRQARKAAFSRPEPGFSLYEGRTRGKRMKYTFSDEEEDYSDALSTRRSTRHSGISTPADAGPVVTASGRQVRSRHQGFYGESLLTDQRKEFDKSEKMDVDEGALDEEPTNRSQHQRPSRTNGWRKGSDHIEGYNSLDEMDEESDAVSDEHDWEAEDDDEPELGDDEEEESDGGESDDFDAGPQDSLVVQLRYRGSNASKSSPIPSAENPAHSEDTKQAEPATSTDSAHPAQSVQPVQSIQPEPQTNGGNPLPSQSDTGKSVASLGQEGKTSERDVEINGTSTKPADNHISNQPPPGISV